MPRRKLTGTSGPPLGMALVAGSNAAKAIIDMEKEKARMNDNVKALFESLMSGEDELTASLRSNHQTFYTGCTKLLTNKDGSRIMSDKVTLRNKDELCEEDYMKLVKICASAVKNYAGTDDYRMYTKPIGEYIKQFAPLALGTVMKVMQSAPKAETRLKAAQDLLNRSGEKEPDRVADVQVPVQVNIMLTDQKGNTVKYEGGS